MAAIKARAAIAPLALLGLAALSACSSVRDHKGYIVDSTKLAFIRQRLVSGRAAEGAQVEEAAMLAAIVARRSALTPPA